MDLPEDISCLLQPLFSRFPPDQVMQQLVVRQAATTIAVEAVEHLLDGVGDQLPNPLCSALWLYADELDRSHAISQGIKNATGSFWHGIMHRREGDFSNSHYWFDKVGDHPAMSQLDGYDAHGFIDAVELDAGRQSPELVARQQAEWQGLFAWCAQNPD
jgi:hypothetical protein